jgi:hypothetical protein
MMNNRGDKIYLFPFTKIFNRIPPVDNNIGFYSVLALNL